MAKLNVDGTFLKPNLASHDILRCKSRKRLLFGVSNKFYYQSLLQAKSTTSSYMLILIKNKELNS